MPPKPQFKLLFILFAFRVCLSPWNSVSGETHSQPSSKPRLIILTDIGGDPDDQQSLIRLLLYANEFKIECLIASASGTPGELKTAVTKPQLIREILEAYGKVQPNLNRHVPGFPSAAVLLKRIKSGNPQRGRKAIGDSHDTEGSRWIIHIADQADPRPINIAIWGGQTDLAQALWRVRKDRGPQGLKEFIKKLLIYDIADQDGIAEWIWQEFPGLFYVLSKAPKGRDKREAAFRGLYLGGDQSLVSRKWMETHIRLKHGPLGALYPPRTWTAPNPHSAIKEGDTPSWFYFLPNGFSDPAHPDWGCWGGRFEKDALGVWRDAQDTVEKVTSARATVWRWRAAFQADFQARLDWCVVDEFSKANHNPVVVLNDHKTRQVIHVMAKAGETVHLSANGSHDPDGDGLSFRWFLYPEAGPAAEGVKLSTDAGASTSFVAPTGTTPQTIHVILEIQDDGKPSLTSFRRVVVHVR